MRAISLKALVYTFSPATLHPLLKRIESSAVGSRLARGVFWSMAGAVISRGLMLCASVLVVRMLGKTGYGELGMIQSTVGMFGVFADFGLGMTATKHVAEFRQSDPERTGRIIGLSGLFALLTGGLMALGLFIFAPWLASNTINAPHLASVLRIGAAILFINALNGAQTGALSGFEAFKTIARVNLFVGLISFPIMVAGAYVGGLTGAVWALAINLCFNWLLNHIALRREARRCSVPFTLNGCMSEWPVLWKFSLPAVLGGTLVGPVNWICNTMLVNRPGGYSEMGIYSAANQWFAMFMFLPGILGSVLLPILSDQMGQNNSTQFKKTVAMAIKINFIIVVPMIIAASVASPYIMSLYGEDFINGWKTLVIVLITAGLLSIQSPVGQIIAASGKMWTGLLMNFGWALVFVLTTFFIINMGAFGLATSRAIAYVFHAIWTFWFAFIVLRTKKIK